MFQQNLSEKFVKNGFHSTPKTHRVIPEDNTTPIIERKLAIYGLILSIFIVVVKLFYLHYEAIESFVWEQKLVSYETLTDDGRLMFTYAWKRAVRYSRYWLPILCGFLTTYFTWIMVYLDSNVPGQQPPSPFSPQKYKIQSGHTFHLNYVFAVIVGILVTIYTFYKGISIEY